MCSRRPQGVLSYRELKKDSRCTTSVQLHTLSRRNPTEQGHRTLQADLQPITPQISFKIGAISVLFIDFRGKVTDY